MTVEVKLIIDNLPLIIVCGRFMPGLQLLEMI